MEETNTAIMTTIPILFMVNNQCILFFNLNLQVFLGIKIYFKPAERPKCFDSGADYRKDNVILQICI